MADKKEGAPADDGTTPSSSAGPPTDAARSAQGGGQGSGPDQGQGQSQSQSQSQSGPLTWSAGAPRDETPPPPPGSLDALRARLGADLDRYGLDLVRRALGELHIAALGGTPASALAREVAERIEAAEASWFNEQGRDQAQHEFRSLNNRGTLTP